MRDNNEDGDTSVGQPAGRQRRRVLSLLSALGLVAGGLVVSATVASAAASGPVTLSPQTAEIAPGSYVDVTVANTSTKKSTSALSSSVSVSSPDFQVTNGCLGIALGKGKSCTVRIAYTATTAPSADQTATLTVVSKKPGVVDSETGTYTVKAPTGCAKNTATGSVASNDLQAVISGAAAGDTIQITGTCAGNFGIDKNLTLAGVAGTSATLDGNQAGRVLSIASGAVTVTDLTITNGLVSGAGFGGGIFNQGTLTLDHATVTGNSILTTGGEGGGVGNVGTLTVSNSTISTTRRKRVAVSRWDVAPGEPRSSPRRSATTLHAARVEASMVAAL